MSTKHMDVAEGIRRHLEGDVAHVSLVADHVRPTSDRTAGVILATAVDSDRIFRIRVETIGWNDMPAALAELDDIGYSPTGTRADD